MTPRKQAHDWTDRAAAALFGAYAVIVYGLMIVGASCVWRCLIGGG